MVVVDAMDDQLRFFFLLGSAACFLLAVFGGTKRGRILQPEALVPLGLLLWVLPTLWDVYERAF
jgi:hypothetical protein